MIQIRLENVSKKIKDTWVLKDINAIFNEGKVYGLSGCNGSGKTMLLRMIAGLISPTKGKIYMDNKILHEDMDFPESIGVLIENPNFWNNYTGYEVMKTLAKIKNIAGDVEIKRAMERINLDPKDNRVVKKYSLGMRQKLGIAQAIMEKPSILLLDEPTNALDKKSIEKVRSIITEEAEQGTIVILASHNAMDLQVCDEIIEMEEGKIICE